MARWAFKENHGTPLGQSLKDIMYAKLQDVGGYSNVEKLVLLPDAGNVGIGIHSPSAVLDVHNAKEPASTVGSESEFVKFSGTATNLIQFKFL